MPDNTTTPAPVIYGEVLFDRFPDGRSIAGGAPFNVAWHLAGFGLQPTFISRIGNDEAGEHILQLMQQWSMDSSRVQRDAQHSTGRVNISLNQGQPSFDIVADQAYDHIDYAPMADFISRSTPPLLYCGSLIRRHNRSRQTLEQLISRNIPLFVDINLRAPWWQQQDALALLDRARWVKLNEHELALLTQQHIDPGNMEQIADTLRRQHDIELLIVTLGEAGAFMLDDRDCYRQNPPPVTQLADTVGAGDAFSSVVVTGILHHWPLALMLERALQFAALICAQPGATAMNHDLYKQLKLKWKLDDT